MATRPRYCFGITLRNKPCRNIVRDDSVTCGRCKPPLVVPNPYDISACAVSVEAEKNTNQHPSANVELRDYQIELLNRLDEALLECEFEKRVLLQAETGSGKSIMGSAWIADRLTHNADTVVGWMTHKDELKDQSRDALQRCGVPIKRFVTATAKRAWTPGAVTVFSPTTRVPPPPPNNLLLVDEAQHSLAPSWRAQIEAEWEIVVGLSGTPWSLDKNANFGSLWSGLVVGPSYTELKHAGHLVDYRIVYPTYGATINRQVLRRDASGEFSNKTVQGEVMRLLATDHVYDQWDAATKGLRDRRTILFAHTVVAAEEAALQFQHRGETAAVLHAKTPLRDRRRIVQEFHAGQITVLANVAVVTEGFDCPAAAVVIILRPTESLGLHRQMFGRALRPAKGKKRAVMVDLAGNTLQHGGPDRIVNWSLDPRGVAHAGHAPYAVCPYECGAANHIATGMCPRCQGQLVFMCGSCYRNLIFRQFRYSTPEPADDDPSVSEEDEDNHAPLGIVDKESFCLECEQVALERRKKRVKDIKAKMFSSLRPDKWKWASPNRVAYTKAPWGWQIKVAATLPECPDSEGTLFAFQNGNLLVYAIYAEDDRDWRMSAYGKQSRSKRKAYVEKRYSRIPINQSATHHDAMSDLLKSDISFMAAMHLTCTQEEAPLDLPPSGTSYGALRYEAQSWDTESVAAEQNRKKRARRAPKHHSRYF